MTGSAAPERAHPAVFLDRDGVLNRAVIREGRPFSPGSAEEAELIEGVEAACRALKAAGFILICVTNQPDIARRTRTRAEVEAINEKIKAALGLDDIRMCPHDDGDGCACRKPKPGLLLDASKDFDIDLKSSIMVGDRWRDVEAGKQAGCRTVFVDHGYAEKRPAGADFVCSRLADALAWIIGSPNGP